MYYYCLRISSSSHCFHTKDTKNKYINVNNTSLESTKFATMYQLNRYRLTYSVIGPIQNLSKFYVHIYHQDL